MQPLLLHYRFTIKNYIMPEINLIEVINTAELWDTTWKEENQ